MTSPYMRPIHETSDHARILMGNGLSSQWPRFYAARLCERLSSEQQAVRDNQEPNGDRFEGEAYTPTAEYAAQLTSWGNALGRNGFGAADLTNPESIAASRDVAHELAEQSDTVELLHTIAYTRRRECEQRINTLEIARNGPAPSTHTRRILGRLSATDQRTGAMYKKIVIAARNLADWRQLPMTSEIREDPAFIEEYGFTVSETPLHALVALEQQTAPDQPATHQAAREESSDLRIAHREQAEQMAYYGNGLEWLHAILRRRQEKLEAFRDVAWDASAAMIYQPHPKSHIHRAQQKVIGIYQKESEGNIRWLSGFMDDLEKNIATRYEQARFDIYHGHDKSDLYRQHDLPLTKILPLYIARGTHDQ